MEENKKMFVSLLGNLIKRHTREGKAIKAVRYEMSLTSERVVIERWAGPAYTQRIDVTGDNCLTIMLEICRALR